MLQLTAIGRLTKEPEIKQNKKGKDFVVFDLAVNRGSGENQTTTYVSCCAGNFWVSPLSKAKKGSLISITGDLSTELYQKKDGSTGEAIKCLISSFYYIPVGDGKKKEQQNQNGQQANGTSQYQPNNSAPQQNNGSYQYQQNGAPQYQPNNAPQYQNRNGNQPYNAPQSNGQYQNNRSYQQPQQYAPPQDQGMPDDYGEYNISDEDLPF